MRGWSLFAKAVFMPLGGMALALLLAAGCNGGNGGGVLDADGDGISDTLDACTGTLAGAAVNADGCSTAQLSAHLAAGFYHTCAVTGDGGAKCWGDNSAGQLGDGSTIDSNVPKAVTGLSDPVTAITVGPLHTCAVTEVGGGWCWGNNNFGLLGDGTLNSSDLPVAVDGLSEGVAAIAAGGRHTCAVTDDKKVMCWGYNEWGQIGNDSYNLSFQVPDAVVGLPDPVIAVSAGDRHTCAVTEGGAVWCWGDNDYGQLGTGRGVPSRVPVEVTELPEPAVTVSAGSEHTCAVTEVGGAWCWGSNVFGELGISDPNPILPVPVTGLSEGVTAIAAGSHHTCARMDTGEVKCWGDNHLGQLGNDLPLLQYPNPVPVVGLDDITAVSTGYYHSCAKSAAGGVTCWGYNDSGQLGHGHEGNAHAHNLPEEVLDFP